MLCLVLSVCRCSHLSHVWDMLSFQIEFLLSNLSMRKLVSRPCLFSVQPVKATFSIPSPTFYVSASCPILSALCSILFTSREILATFSLPIMTHWTQFSSECHFLDKAQHFLISSGFIPFQTFLSLSYCHSMYLDCIQEL